MDSFEHLPDPSDESLPDKSDECISIPDNRRSRSLTKIQRLILSKSILPTDSTLFKIMNTD